MSTDPSATEHDRGPASMPTCPRCGVVVADELRAQHDEWHRRVEDATFGACPA